MHNSARISYLKVIATCLVLVLNVGYIAYSYYQATQAIKIERETLFLETKEEINEAIKHFSQYLNLTEARLSHSADDSEIISRILAEKTEGAVSKSFPEIMGLSFFPSSHPDISYTRFGKAFHKSLKQNEGIVHLGKGIFEWIRKIQNKYEQSLGTLDSIFSLSKILYRHFPESEMSIVYVDEVELIKNPLSFKIEYLPYVIMVSGHSFTFWQFLWESKFHIFSILLLSLMVFFVGTAAGISIMQKAFSRQRAFINRLQGKLKNLEKQNNDIGTQLAASKNLAKRREHSQKERHLLKVFLTERYRHMAGQAQAINMWTSQLILEEAQNDHLLKKIHSVSQEGTSVLRQLVNGFPMKFMEEEIDVIECIEDIKEMFLPEMIENNISFEIKGNIQKFPRTDKIIFKIILHNIFHIVMDRLSKNGVFIIELKEDTPLQMSFYDSGYDVGPKIQLIKDPLPPEDILYLENSRLVEFTSYLNFKLSFENTAILTNTIKLTFPMILEERERPSNVINLFGDKTYEQ
ncbi:hypothetical protein QM565_32620 [Geitlerinema splendidum]|nr:hypothetical protein [Geitlerinema splendidum]